MPTFAAAQKVWYSIYMVEKILSHRLTDA